LRWRRMTAWHRFNCLAIWGMGRPEAWRDWTWAVRRAAPMGGSSMPSFFARRESGTVLLIDSRKQDCPAFPPPGATVVQLREIGEVTNSAARAGHAPPLQQAGEGKRWRRRVA
jgi:hypothetical protein